MKQWCPLYVFLYSYGGMHCGKLHIKLDSIINFTPAVFKAQVTTVWEAWAKLILGLVCELAV